MSFMEYMQIPLFQRGMIAAVVTGATLPLLGVVIATLNLTVIALPSCMQGCWEQLSGSAWVCRHDRGLTTIS